MPGIYIHIPFCKQACHYCNFHFSTSLAQKEKMVEAIVTEIALSPSLLLKEKGDAEIAANFDKEIISTLYFGGGTPSILSIDELKIIFEALQQRFVFADDIEITLEANPDDITETKLKAWLNLGINRLSVGIQSFLEEELKWMNRAHTATESIACIDLIKAAGFINFSVDLIYGSPILTDDDWKRNVELVIEKDIPHISCYALTVEPRTALDKMIALHKKEPVDAEKQARQFLLLMDWMEQAGYEHYEISNFAKPGLRSKHNSSYWSGEYYYAFGPAAHAFDGKSRRWNVANNALYIQSLQKGIIPFEEEILTETQQLNEYIMTSLRTIEGLDLDYVSNIFGAEKSSRIKAAGNKYESTGKLKAVKGKLILTREGKLFADGIAADLFL
ncbi:MAG: radical SAM family heme chaperone HemW [Chitinophagaceae bacterium]|nr:radical SAM family heme chaperone HemW [Chitinophagaceae bacterium]